MTIESSITAIPLLAALVACVSCGAGGSFDSVSGTVQVDGAPVDAGTISLRPADPSLGGPAGGSIENGAFHAVARDSLSPGKYLVMVQAAQKTGRTINDPQRGPVEETAALAIAGLPKEIELNAANASNLLLDFQTPGR